MAPSLHRTRQRILPNADFLACSLGPVAALLAHWTSQFAGRTCLSAGEGDILDTKDHP